MSEHHDPVAEAIARGDRTAALLNENRDALFKPMAALLLIAGADGLRACSAGVVEAVIAAQQGIVWGEKRRPTGEEAQP